MGHLVRKKAEELFNYIDNEKDFILIDTRTKEDYNSWPVRWIKAFDELNIPYYEFMDDREAAMERIPKDKTIISICNRGNASDEIAEVLRESGFDAYSIEDGMKSWGSYYHSAFIEKNENGGILQVNRIAKGCLSYIIWSENQAIVIDAARHIKQYLEFLKDNNLHLRYVLDTHLHADHISGGEALSRLTGAEYYVNENDVSGDELSFHSIKDGMEFVIGDSKLKAVGIYTPGHTPGSTSFFLDNRYIFTGDILMLSSLGRPDLGGEAIKWVKDLWNTVRHLEKLDESITVLPAHSTGVREFDNQGRVISTLKDLRKTNHLLTLNEKKLFEKEILESLPEQPDSYKEMRDTNMGKKHPDEEEMSELELGKNQCGVESYKEGVRN